MMRNRSAIRLFSTVKPFSEIPSPGNLPYIGSFHTVGSLKNPWTQEKIHQEDMNTLFRSLHKKYGPIVAFAMPGVGKMKGNRWGSIVVFDPREYRQIIENQPKIPLGATTMMWPASQAWRDNKLKTAVLFDESEEWLKFRQQFQKNLSGPKDARKYIPSIVAACKLGVEGAQREMEKDNLFWYLNHIAFDMQFAILLGKLSQIADSATPSDARCMKFVKDMQTMLSNVAAMSKSPKEMFTKFLLGRKSKMQKVVNGNVADLMSNSAEIVRELRERWENGTLTEIEKKSYTVAFFNREQDTDMSEEESAEMLGTLMLGGIDGTATHLVWLLIHLGQNQECQDKVREEILRVLGPEEGLHHDVQLGKELPYTMAVMRESYRLNPAMPHVAPKTADKDVVMNGYNVPAGTAVMFNNTVLSVDERYVDDPWKFQPERFLPEAIEARKGTDRELIDHPLMGYGFSHGARMCPAMRVVNYQITIFLTELVRRWKFEVDPSIKFEERNNMAHQPLPYPQVKFTSMDLSSLKSS